MKKEVNLHTVGPAPTTITSHRPSQSNKVEGEGLASVVGIDAWICLIEMSRKWKFGSSLICIWVENN
jgi:hypothetical protein